MLDFTVFRSFMMIKKIKIRKLIIATISKGIFVNESIEVKIFMSPVLLCFL